MRRHTRVRLLSTALPSAVLAIALAAGPIVASSTYVIKAREDDTWSPSRLTALRGDVVKWRNVGGFHDVHITQPSAYVSSDPVGEGTLIHRETVVGGTYRFFCSIHDGMDGILRVKPVLRRSGSVVTVQLGPVDAPFRHQIQRRRGSSGSWTGVFTSQGQDSRSFTLSSGTWQFRVELVNGSTSSRWSPVVSISVP